MLRAILAFTLATFLGFCLGTTAWLKLSVEHQHGVASLLPPIIPPAITGSVAALACVYTSYIGQKNKKIDVMLSFRQRYDQLVNLERYELIEKLRGADKPTGDRRTAHYFRRFWGLQLDQWLAWKEGLLPPRIYAEWMSRRTVDFRENEKLSNGLTGEDRIEWSFAGGWLRTKPSMGHTRFCDMVDGFVEASKPKSAPKA